ncbi:NADH-quinone oxidoreductase subunit C [Ferrigenium sp. UT5]|uniref:NADH-quinone oxidoreductase subunit D-related protein n=1 Tax=Ferrigenium sp. UT5 TaxID=3242105 RepID=UPI0035517E57
MPIKHPQLQLVRLTDAVPTWAGTIGPECLLEICQQVRDGGGRLVALWGSDERAQGNGRDRSPLPNPLPQAGEGASESLRESQNNGYALHVALINETGLVCLHVPLPEAHPHYPDISRLFPAAARMQRATYDLLGLHPLEATDHRKWLRHGAWKGGSFPLRKDFDATANGAREAEDYAFVQVTGQGVHEIAVGPVHAGIIEPGHFRFSVIGERVLRLEEHLGYTHKGIEKHFEHSSLQQGAKLVGRVSGDSTVAYAWAYAMAAESIAGTTPPDRALWLRALLLERERIANHLGDLGYLGSDVALSFGFAQFWILKEQVLRNNAALFGHRYLMDSIMPGGVAVRLDGAGKNLIEQECRMLEREASILRGIYEEHAGVQDRYIGAGRIAPKLAAQLGLCGMAGRASAQAWDARVQFACAPYDKLDVRMATYRNGDVAARVIVRFDELFESLRLIRQILVNLVHEEETAPAMAQLPPNGFGIGLVEGWRGEVMVAIHTDAKGNLARVHPHDPSWQNWPVLEHAIIDNIVPDFPLINKSFNLSYSGHDL